jgi:farnesyl-diphosphate farnesyltransferase
LLYFLLGAWKEREMNGSITRITAIDPAVEAADRDFCIAALPRVSRTFALSIEALSDDLRDAVRVAYLLCRVVDTIEDEPRMKPVLRVPLFDAFDRLMAGDDADPAAFEALARGSRLAEHSADGVLCRGAGHLFRAYRRLPGAQREAIRPHVLEMSAGMRHTCARADAAGGALRLHDVPDLERYCYYVAGTVGELLTGLFAHAVPELSEASCKGVTERAVSFGIGLQLVNIVKDVAEDFERGICFLPQSVAERHGLPLTGVLDAGSREAGLAVVHELCGTARMHLARAREYVALWPGDEAYSVRLFCAVPLALALATLREVETGPDTLRAGAKPKIGRDLVGAIVEEAAASASSNDALNTLFERCLSGTMLAVRA